jgi:hypothetical protein
MNEIFNSDCCSWIFELCHIFNGFISYQYIIILSCFLMARHKHIPSFFYLFYINLYNVILICGKGNNLKANYSRIFFINHEAFIAMKVQIVVFWVVTLCSDVLGYPPYHITTWCHNPEGCDLNLHHCENKSQNHWPVQSSNKAGGLKYLHKSCNQESLHTDMQVIGNSNLYLAKSIVS